MYISQARTGPDKEVIFDLYCGKCNNRKTVSAKDNPDLVKEILEYFNGEDRWIP